MQISDAAAAEPDEKVVGTGAEALMMKSIGAAGCINRKLGRGGGDGDAGSSAAPLALKTPRDCVHLVK